MFSFRIVMMAIRSLRQNLMRSMIDTILTEDQQTGARSELVIAGQNYAKILAQLRFDSGQLVIHTGEQSVIAKEIFGSVPYGSGPSQ